ncbi:hypothetical protein [Pseudoduganella albidiflava]|uniref:Uncharacterized protein n=1 Tax=Pseudoduganella albidiflava TaxID=321983 RepID=A0ABX5RXX9_9BURK|nr:hypothetical protein [Pseudoduganella albidiflava]QBI02846.1 hypothetical protein EYF70_19840 [Pseudoduganella albidiflava]
MSDRAGPLRQRGAACRQFGNGALALLGNDGAGHHIAQCMQRFMAIEAQRIDVVVADLRAGRQPTALIEALSMVTVTARAAPTGFAVACTRAGADHARPGVAIARAAMPVRMAWRIPLPFSYFVLIFFEIRHCLATDAGSP